MGKICGANIKNGGALAFLLPLLTSMVFLCAMYSAYCTLLLCYVLFVPVEYFDQWVCETACSVGKNVISTRLFSTLCMHQLRKAFVAWRQATRTSQAATRTQRICLRKYAIVNVVEFLVSVNIMELIRQGFSRGARGKFAPWK